MRETIKQYILDNWDKTIKFNQNDDDTLIGLPKPYTIPCASDMFQEMYYWDTYFTNVGLMLSGREEQAKNNADNMMYLINRYGMMPNGNRTHYLNRSQPPFLSQMIREIFDALGDMEWLRTEAYPTLEKEYDFWQNNRQGENGLACYGGVFKNEGAENGFCNYFCERASLLNPQDKETRKEYAYACLAQCESGWDLSSRFALDAHKVNAIDLNSLLFILETNMAYFAEKLGKNEDKILWDKRAEERSRLINKFLWDNDRKMFCDRNTQKDKLNGVFSAASFYPMFAGLATEEQAKNTVANLSLIECEYGVAGCEDNGKLMGLQWDYPHGWACLHYIIIKALLKYGYKEDALRIAEKYVETVVRNFETTNNLWEKYNVVTGKVSVTNEYDTPPMMGWSAGIYLYCLDLLSK